MQDRMVVQELMVTQVRMVNQDSKALLGLVVPQGQ